MDNERGEVLDNGLATKWVAFPARATPLEVIKSLDTDAYEYERSMARWYYVCGPRNDSDFIADIRVPNSTFGARDAKIMVAAAEMLEALKTVRGWFDGFDLKDMNLDESILPVLAKVDAAIDAANSGNTPGLDCFGAAQ